MKRMRFLSLIILSFLLISLFGCKITNSLNKTIFAFSTTIDITVYSNNDLDKIYMDISNIFDDYSKLSDNFEEYDNINNLYTINHSTDFVEVDERLIALLNYSLMLKEQTSGYFNPLIGNISLLYKGLLSKAYPTSKDIPSAEVIASELIIMNNSTINIEDNKVKIIGGATIDLGAIAKGYALNEVRTYLLQNNIDNYLINAGSSSILLGEKENGIYYNVGLKYDEDCKLKARNISIGTSSVLEQYVDIGYDRFHHIINPLTGTCNNNYDTIYLFGENSGEIDAYVTAFMSMDLDNIKAICLNKGLNIIIYKDNYIIYQSNTGDIYE